MRKFVDTGYKYDPLYIRFDPSRGNGVFLDDSQLSNAKTQYRLICVGNSNRYPLWQNKKSGAYVGGLYPIASQNKITALFELFKKETQIIGYVDQKNDSWGRSLNPFPSSLNDGLPRHVWAFSYEKGSRVYREERHLRQLEARNLI